MQLSLSENEARKAPLELAAAPWAPTIAFPKFDSIKRVVLKIASRLFLLESLHEASVSIPTRATLIVSSSFYWPDGKTREDA